ncbi:MAG: hypothetical protein JST28_16610 [Acidobacteria bacterium]|nr:hypothetical protein [Acidobacteriota bacterium]
MFEGLRYYVPVLLTTGGLFAVGGVFLAIVWLLLISHWLRSQKEEPPRGLIPFTSAVLLPGAAIGLYKFAMTVGIAMADWLVIACWWSALAGSFMILIFTRRQLKTETGLIADITAGGTIVVLCLMALGFVFQVVFFFLK